MEIRKEKHFSSVKKGPFNLKKDRKQSRIKVPYTEKNISFFCDKQLAELTFNNKENRSHKVKFSNNWEAFECNKVNESIAFENDTDEIEHGSEKKGKSKDIYSVNVKCIPKLSINNDCFETDTWQADSGKEKSRKNNMKSLKFSTELSKRNENKNLRIESLHSTECTTRLSCNTLSKNYDNNVGLVKDMRNFPKNSVKSVKSQLWNDIVQPCFVHLKRIDFKLEQFQLKNNENSFSHCSKNNAKSIQAVENQEMIRPCSVFLYRINLESFLPAECINSKNYVISHNIEPAKKKAKLADECKKSVLNKYKYCKSFNRSSNNYNLRSQLDTSVGKCYSLGSRQLSRVPFIKNGSDNLKCLQKYSLNNVEARQVPFSVNNSQVNFKVHSILPFERTQSSYSDMNLLPHIDANSEVQLHKIVRPCCVRVLRLNMDDISKKRINQHSKITIIEKALPSIDSDISVKTIAISKNTSKSRLYNTQEELLGDLAGVVDSYHQNKGVCFDNGELKIKLKPCYVRVERFSFKKYASETTIRSMIGEGKSKIFEACDLPMKYKETALKCLGQKEKSTSKISKILELEYDLNENKLKTSEDTFSKKGLMECDKIDVNMIDKSDSIEFLPRKTDEFGNSNCVLKVTETSVLPYSIVLKKIQLNGDNLKCGGTVGSRKSLEKYDVDSVNSIKNVTGDCKRNVELPDSFFQRTIFENSFSANRNIEEQEKNLTVVNRKIKTTRHICVQCYALLPSAKALYDHICNGKGKRGHVCQFCEKIFKTSQRLQTHKFSHIVVK